MYKVEVKPVERKKETWEKPSMEIKERTILQAQPFQLLLNQDRDEEKVKLEKSKKYSQADLLCVDIATRQER